MPTEVTSSVYDDAFWLEHSNAIFASGIDQVTVEHCSISL